MIAHAAASGQRRQNGGLAGVVLRDAGAAVSTAGAGTEAAFSPGSEGGTLSGRLTSLTTLRAAGAYGLLTK